MKKLLLISLLCVVAPAMALPNEGGPAKLTASQVLLKELKLDASAMHACQPLKGEKVHVLEIKKNYDGLKLDVARVRVTEGKCAGNEGWVGMSRLEFIGK